MQYSTCLSFLRMSPCLSVFRNKATIWKFLIFNKGLGQRGGRGNRGCLGVGISNKTGPVIVPDFDEDSISPHGSYIPVIYSA